MLDERARYQLDYVNPRDLVPDRPCRTDTLPKVDNRASEIAEPLLTPAQNGPGLPAVPEYVPDAGAAETGEQ